MITKTMASKTGSRSLRGREFGGLPRQGMGWKGLLEFDDIHIEKGVAWLQYSPNKFSMGTTSIENISRIPMV